MYGAGNTGRCTVNVLKKMGVTVTGIIDANKTGNYKSIPIFHLSDVPDTLKALPVIISIFNPDAACAISKIVRDLSDNGFSLIQPFETFFCKNHQYFPENYFWLCRPEFTIEHRHDFAKVEKILCDDASKRLLNSQIEFRCTGSIDVEIPTSPPELQYFDPSVYKQKEFREFWDIGAFSGDTLECAAKAGMRFKRVLAFEPDMKNYDLLCSYISAHGGEYEDIMAIPSAIGTDNTILAFAGGATTSSAVSLTGNTKVPSIAMDRAYPSGTPDFVKMDIEGSELSALKGMRNIILKSAPLLAICVYHRPEDLFAIPLYLNDLLSGSDYQFCLRNYGQHLMETVFYAVPGMI